MIKELIAEVLVDKHIEALSEGAIFGADGKLNRQATKAMMLKYKGCIKASKDTDKRKKMMRCQLSSLKKARSIYKAGIGVCKDNDKCRSKVTRWIKDCDQEIGRMQALLKVK